MYNNNLKLTYFKGSQTFVENKINPSLSSLSSLSSTALQDTNSSSTALSTDSSSFKDTTIHFSLSNLQESDFWALLLLYPCLYGILIVVSAKLFNHVARYMNALLTQ